MCETQPSLAKPSLTKHLLVLRGISCQLNSNTTCAGLNIIVLDLSSNIRQTDDLVQLGPMLFSHFVSARLSSHPFSEYCIILFLFFWLLFNLAMPKPSFASSCLIGVRIDGDSHLMRI